MRRDKGLSDNGDENRERQDLGWETAALSAGGNVEAGRCENHYQVSGETPGREGVVSSVWGWGSGLRDASGRGAGGGGGGLGRRRSSGTCSLGAGLGRGYGKVGEPTGSGWVKADLLAKLTQQLQEE